MLGLYDVVAHERTVITVMSVVFYQCRDAQSKETKESKRREKTKVVHLLGSASMYVKR